MFSPNIHLSSLISSLTLTNLTSHTSSLTNLIVSSSLISSSPISSLPLTNLTSHTSSLTNLILSSSPISLPLTNLILTSLITSPHQSHISHYIPHQSHFPSPISSLPLTNLTSHTTSLTNVTQLQLPTHHIQRQTPSKLIPLLVWFVKL